MHVVFVEVNFYNVVDTSIIFNRVFFNKYYIAARCLPLMLTICTFCRSYLWCYSSWSGCNCCNRYHNLQNKVRFLKNQLVYDTKIHNYLYVLLRREVWANTTTLKLWYLQTLLNPATFY